MVLPMDHFDWTQAFQPAEIPDKNTRTWPAPVVFENRDHRLEVLEERAENFQHLWHPEDKDLPEVHDRVGYRGSDRRANGTDTTPELDVYDAFDDDPPTELPPGWLDMELADFRARRERAAILSFPAAQGAVA